MPDPTGVKLVMVGGPMHGQEVVYTYREVTVPYVPDRTYEPWREALAVDEKSFTGLRYEYEVVSLSNGSLSIEMAYYRWSRMSKEDSRRVALGLLIASALSPKGAPHA